MNVEEKEEEEKERGTVVEQRLTNMSMSSTNTARNLFAPKKDGRHSRK